MKLAAYVYEYLHVLLNDIAKFSFYTITDPIKKGYFEITTVMFYENLSIVKLIFQKISARRTDFDERPNYFHKLKSVQSCTV